MCLSFRESSVNIPWGVTPVGSIEWVFGAINLPGLENLSLVPIIAGPENCGLIPRDVVFVFITWSASADFSPCRRATAFWCSLFLFMNFLWVSPT